MVIILGTSKQENFHRSEEPLEKKQETNNEARISREVEMKRRFNINQKSTLWDIQLSSLIFWFILKIVLFWGKFHLGHSLLLFPHLHFISLITKNKLNLENDRMVELHKKRLGWNKLIKPQKKMTHFLYSSK